MEAIAEHDFNANADDELSFKRGQILKVLNKDEDPHWFKAELDGREGFVPSNYIKMKDSFWYLGKILRVDAEAILKKQGNVDGNFLVRQSESSPGDFSISVKFEDGAQHFKVMRDQQGKYYIWNVRFSSLNELINYYRYEKLQITSSVSRTYTILLQDLNLETKFVQALFDFNPQEEGELSFKRGEIITLVNKDDPNWWEGTSNGKRGVFPANYVCPYNHSATYNNIA